MDTSGEPRPQVTARPAGPEDRVSYDVLRWTRTGRGDVPDAEELLRRACRSVEPVAADGSLGTVLAADLDLDVVVGGRTADHHWLAARYLLPLRPRSGPWPVLRTQADEVRRVTCSEVLEAVAWAHWQGGSRVREVDLGLSGGPFARGRAAPFEQGLWSGSVRRAPAEPELVPVPPEHVVDAEALIAAEPPEHLIVSPEDGARMLVLTEVPAFLDQEPFRHYTGYVSFGEDPSQPLRRFLNPDTVNLTPVWDDGLDDDLDVGRLAVAATSAYLGLRGPVTGWGWPCRVWRVAT